MKAVTIYGLVCPVSKNIRYIGKTSQSTTERLLEHLKEVSDPLKSYYHSKNWIRNLMKEGLIPQIITIEKCNENDWREREIFWIETYKNLGCNLTNMTSGGDGRGGKRPEGYKCPSSLAVDIYFSDGTFIKTVASMSEAEKETGVDNSKISLICRNKGRYNYNGYTFRLEGSPFERTREKSIWGLKVFVLDKNLELLEICKNSKEVFEKYKIFRSCVSECCLNPKKKNGEFRLSKRKYILLYEKEYNEYVKELKL